MSKAKDQLFKIAKAGECSSLSGKSSLNYQIGYDGQSNIYFRVTANSGGGWFSGDWVSMQVIQSALDKAPTPLTSYALQILFKGKSVNTPAFLFAALKQEGLVSTDPNNPRCYLATATDDFMSRMHQVIAAGIDLKFDAKVTGKGMVKAKRTADVIPVISTSSSSKIKPIKSQLNANIA